MVLEPQALEAQTADKPETLAAVSCTTNDTTETSRRERPLGLCECLPRRGAVRRRQGVLWCCGVTAFMKLVLESSRRSPNERRNVSTMNKLPRVTLAFWIMKIAATTLGETAGDLLSMTLKVGYAVSSMILVGLLVVSLVTQLRSSHYHQWLYWTVILLTSTAGTTMSDFMDRTLGLGYAKGTLILLTILAAVFAYWRYSAHSFSIQDIRTLKGESLYWTAILFSNTLGTALGDFLADSSGLGFGGGALLMGVLLALTAAATLHPRISKTLLFWVAFVLTRPFGATMGDVLTKSREKGGLNFGTIGSSLVLASILGILILRTSVHQNKDAG